MTQHHQFQSGLMPPIDPLPRPLQRFDAPFHDPEAPGLPVRPMRWASFVPAFAVAIALAVVFRARLAAGGVTPSELALIGLICVAGFWVALSVGTAAVGLWALRQRPAIGTGPALHVALIMPIYNEATDEVFGNAMAMLEDVQRITRARGHRYDLFILSDTRDDGVAASERRAVALLRDSFGQAVAVHYRRRMENTDHKTGNLADWIEHWGGGYDAMLVLDADSLMSGDAIGALSDALAADPGAGLIQTFPQISDARSLFGRMQQFAGAAYGVPLAAGLARWSGDAGNFWGHNAIVRTRAFAACAGLPRLRNLAGQDALILSHDFVEAGLLRRAGWAVRFLPQIADSYEQVPQTLVDYCLRDRRWCQGNLQHLRLLGAAGFHPVTRLHLLQGAFSYLMSIVWCALLIVWAVMGPGTAHAGGWAIMLAIYGLLLAPKVLGLVAVAMTSTALTRFGGWPRLLVSCAAEVVLSVLFAPVLMVQQVIAVLRVWSAAPARWVPQRRCSSGYPWRALIGFHRVETVAGIGLLTGMGAGAVSLWLLPIAASLSLAAPLSALSGVAMPRGWLLASAEHYAPSAIQRAAWRYRRHVAKGLSQADRPDRLAAE